MAGTNTTRAARRPSLVGAAVTVIGLLLLAYGLTGLIFGSADFETNTGGTVDGETWLALEGNGWTNLLFAGAGGLLILGSPTRAATTVTMTLTSVALGAAAIIAVFDGDDVFGVFAANGWTMLAWGATALLLLAAAALRRTTSAATSRTVGGPPRQRDEDGPEAELERELLRPGARRR